MGFLPQRLLFDTDDTRARRLGARRPGTTFPAGPVIGDIFYETDTNKLWVWNGAAWKEVYTSQTASPTFSGTIYADRFQSDPADGDDSKFIIYSGQAHIGYRTGGDDMYFYSAGGNYSFEAPGGQWAFRYGPGEVNGGERGMWHSGNDQATERYASGWFRSMNSGNGWYHQVHGGGWYMIDAWLRSYSDHSVYTGNTTGFRGNVANIGAQAYSDHAEFGHNNIFGGGGSFSYLSKWDGHSYMNTNGGELHFHSSNNMMAHWYAGGNFYFELAGFTGTAVIWAGGSHEMGWNSSSARVKREVSANPHGDDNPIFKMKPKRFHWEETRIRNGNEYNVRHPRGIMGLFAEEVHEVAPDAVHLDESGVPMSLDTNTMIGYLVDAIQHCRQLIDEKGK